MMARLRGVEGRIFSHRPYLRAVVLLALGALLGAGQSPLGWPIASLLALFCIFAIFARMGGVGVGGWVRIRPSIWAGWLVGTGYFLATLFWIVEPFQVDAAATGWMAPFALFFMAGGLALFWAAAFGVAAWLGRTARLRIVALVISLALAELARAYVLTGFPWALIGYIWADTPLSQVAAFVGPHGLGLITLGLVALALLFERALIGTAIVAALFAVLWAGGSYRLSQPLQARKTPVRLRLVQPNAPQDEKWDPAKAPIFFNRQLALTRAPAKITPDLVIWPETAISFWLDDAPEKQAEIVAAAPKGSRVIIGALRREGRRKYYNAMALLGADGRSVQTYDKAHLVPFGEYFPLGSFFARFGIYGLASEDGGGFSEGPGAALMDLGSLGRIRPLICYEAIFPQEITARGPRPDWMLQITNDAWFGTLAGPQQHFEQARFRAIEQGLPMVRVANTGISAVIDPKGRVMAELPLGVSGKIDADLPASLPATLYSRTGDGPVLVLLLLGLGGVLLQRRKGPAAGQN